MFRYDSDIEDTRQPNIELEDINDDEILDAFGTYYMNRISEAKAKLDIDYNGNYQYHLLGARNACEDLMMLLDEFIPLLEVLDGSASDRMKYAWQKTINKVRRHVNEGRYTLKDVEEGGEME